MMMTAIGAFVVIFPCLVVLCVEGCDKCGLLFGTCVTMCNACSRAHDRLDLCCARVATLARVVFRRRHAEMELSTRNKADESACV